MTQDERKGLILCLKIEFSDGLGGYYKQKLGMKEQHIILYVGQFVYRKGIDVLIKATKRLTSEYGVYLVGGVPTQEYLDMQKNINNLHFVGFKSKTELAEFYKAADVFVLPTREDIWGLVINEAMAYGLPVITTTTCGSGRELISDDINGYLVQPDNEDELCKAILTLCNDRLKREKIAENNYNKIYKYTIENMAAIHAEVFE